MYAYHYTTRSEFKSMQTPGRDGFSTENFDDFTGLIPGRRFLRIDRAAHLPEKAMAGVSEALLEPCPPSWKDKKKFPYLWEDLIHDFLIPGEDLILLKFEIDKEDDAYVVDRGIMEKALCGIGTQRSLRIAARKYWNSRVPALEYSGGHDAPQFAIWSGIEFERLEPVAYLKVDVARRFLGA